MLIMCQRIGLPPISTMGFGLMTVSSASLVPWPPASMMTFIVISNSHFGFWLHDLRRRPKVRPHETHKTSDEHFKVSPVPQAETDSRLQRRSGLCRASRSDLDLTEIR